MKGNGHIAIRQIPKLAVEQTLNRLYLHTTDDNSGEAGNHAAKSQKGSDSSARQTPKRLISLNTVGHRTR